MKTMKKLGIVCLMLTVLLVVGGSAGAADTGAGKKLGIMWIGKSGMAKRVNSGLEAQLQAKAPGIALEYNKESYLQVPLIRL